MYYNLLHKNTSEVKKLHREVKHKKVNIICKYKTVSFCNKIKEVTSTKKEA